MRQRRRFGLGVAVVFMVVGATLASLSTQVISPSALLQRATSGLDGTFTVTYALRRNRATPFGRAAVTLAQRSPRAASAWLGQRGEWSYRLTGLNGRAIEWFYDGSSFVDCVRSSALGKWSCTGPGSFDATYGSIGYTIATAPFVAGSFFPGLRDAVVDSTTPAKVSAASGSSCLSSGATSTTWCIGDRGMLSSWSSRTPGPMLFSWTSFRELSIRSGVTAQAFMLPARPHLPFVELPE